MLNTIFFVTFTGEQLVMAVAILLVIALVTFLLVELFKTYARVRDLEDKLTGKNIDFEHKKDAALVEKDLTIVALREELGQRQAIINDQNDEVAQLKMDAAHADNQKESYRKLFMSQQTLTASHVSKISQQASKIIELSKLNEDLTENIDEQEKAIKNKDERIRMLESICASHGVTLPLDPSESE